MLTVNLCDNGCQRTIEAVEVRGCSNNSLMHYDEAQIDMPDGRILSVTTGGVFVMNESGATVAKYDFSYPQECGSS